MPYHSSPARAAIAELCVDSARNIEVSASFFGLDVSRVDDLGENEDGENPVAFLPSLSKTYSLWYKGCYMTVTRSQVEEAGSWRRMKEVLEVRYDTVPSLYTAPC